MTIAEQRTTVGLLRVRAAAGDPLAVQMRGEAALRPLDLRPSTLPQRAILCLRRMADPLPGGIDLRTSYAPRPTEWERAARTVIARAAAGAVRPLRDPAAAALADAVLFDDRAEMLACAARDMARRVMPAPWYWARAFPSLTVSALVREIARAPRSVPALVELLAATGDAVAFARLLAHDEAVALCAMCDVPAARLLTTGATPAPRADADRTAHARRARAVSVIPELERYEGVRELTSAQFLFLLIALTLYRAPQHARSEEFAFECAARAALFEAATEIAPLPAPGAPQTEHAARVVDAARSGRAPDARGSAARSPLATRSAGTFAPHPQYGRARRPGEPQPLDGMPAPVPLAGTEAAPPLLHAALQSDHAGLFFLLNVAIALGYYREPPQRRLDVHPYDFLALAARALMPEIEDEPLFVLLDELAPRRRRPRRRLSQRLVGHIRRFLGLAEVPPRMLIRRYGRIVVTPAHLDVFFSLDAHPIEIRMSGLDRNPGWIADAGRHVAFHFD